MKFSLIILASALCISAAAQNRSTKDIPKNRNYTTLTEVINGQWTLDRIVDLEQKAGDAKDKGPNSPSEANANQATNGMQILEFTDDSRYKVNNSTTAVDSGNFVLNERNKSIILESDLSGSTPSEWNVSLKSDELTLVPREAARKRYQYIYSRSKERAAK